MGLRWHGIHWNYSLLISLRDGIPKVTKQTHQSAVSSQGYMWSEEGTKEQRWLRSSWAPETRREEPGETLELMTMQILLLDEPGSGFLRHQTRENEKLRENHFKKSKLMPCAADSRMSQFPKILWQKMAHMKIDMDWILMSQTNITKTGTKK